MNGFRTSPNTGCVISCCDDGRLAPATKALDFDLNHIAGLEDARGSHAKAGA
ncbi:hypothetical protein [Hoeflea phototrophica]|uniref:hypothetical protein n=1 Tax=Hoeflea phototrophica TaxID=244596 RepID=UPI001AEC3FED|nr:hypothetical protein [Hoeflea phototrophica]